MLVRLLIFMVLWVSLGMTLTHFFYPELWENETTKIAIHWLMVIGYAVGTFSSGIADGIGELLKRRG